VIEDTHGFGPPFNPEEGATAVIKLLENAGVRYSPKTSSDTHPKHVWGKSSIRYFPQTSLEEEFHVTYSDGSRYEGDWKDGKEHGRGVLVFVNGDRYEGEFRDGKPHGRGVYVTADGDRYEGEWKDGERTGRGVLLLASGDKREGDWCEGMLLGPGKNREHGQPKKTLH
jgi:hypothetical protein